MADVAVIYQPSLAQIDSLILDCSVSESHVSEIDVTQHPVETGAAITDHARAKPDRVTIEGIISNTPLSRTQVLRVVEAQGISLVTSNPADVVIGQPGNAEAGLATLLDLKDNAKLVTVVTALRTYGDMILTNLNIPKNAQTGEALHFSATFTQVTLVQNQTTQQTVAKEPKAHPKTSEGKQVPGDGSGVEKSWAATLHDNTGLQSITGLTPGTGILKPGLAF